MSQHIPVEYHECSVAQCSRTLLALIKWPFTSESKQGMLSQWLLLGQGLFSITISSFLSDTTQYSDRMWCTDSERADDLMLQCNKGRGKTSPAYSHNCNSRCKTLVQFSACFISPFALSITKQKQAKSVPTPASRKQQQERWDIFSPQLFLAFKTSKVLPKIQCFETLSILMWK